MGGNTNKEVYILYWENKRRSYHMNRVNGSIESKPRTCVGIGMDTVAKVVLTPGMIKEKVVKVMQVHSDGLRRLAN